MYYRTSKDIDDDWLIQNKIVVVTCTLTFDIVRFDWI